MKNKKKILNICMVVALVIGFTFVSSKSVSAASFSISVNKTTIVPGETITLSLNGSGLEGKFAVSVNSGASVTGLNPIWTEETTTIKAGSESFTITVTPKSVVDSSNGLLITDLKAKSIFVTVKTDSGGSGGNSGGSSSNNGGNSNNGGGSWDNSSNNVNNNVNNHVDDTVSEDKQSSDANLKSLTVSEGKLTPEFNPETTQYKVELAASIKTIEVNASAMDSKARVSGTGTKDLEVGENKIDVTVSAENGTTKTYTITAVVDEKPLVYVKKDKQKLGVVRNLNGVVVPSGFEETIVKIEGQEVKAWKNNNMKITLVYLIDEKTSEKNFYIYDTKAKKVKSVFKPVAILGNNLYIVDIDKKTQKMEGFKYEKVKVDNVELMGFTFKDKAFKNYSLIYVMNEKGDMQYYLYEKTQNTLQLYSKAAPITQENYEKLVDELDSSNTLKLTFMILTGMFAITSVVSVFIAVSAKRKRIDSMF